jgi:thymidylate synthase (FAD)
MEVSLISKNSDIVKVVSSAARSCRSAKPAHHFIENWDYPNDMDRETYIQYILGMGHEGIAEFAWFGFSVSGISRVATHQLVRHRIASYLQMSSRHTDVTLQGIKTPPSIRNSKDAEVLFADTGRKMIETYNSLVQMGIEREDARFIFPDGANTHISIGMNARELFHFFKLRLCHEAQWEIRELAEKMLVLARESEPSIFLKSEAPCISGKCIAGRSDCSFPKSDEYKRRKTEFRGRINSFVEEHGNRK